MVSKYQLQPEAERDLEGIWHHTVKHWGVDQAIKYVDALDSAFQILAETPLICRERREFRPPVRIHHHESHLIIYVISDGGIVIVRVLHENMEVEKHLNDA